jgi:hypothetical protein
MRIEGIGHNLLSVLLLLGLPASFVGLVGLPHAWGVSALRPLAWFSVLTFLFTSLAFPVATTWGTFLHAAGPVHVWLVISALLLLDAGIVRLAARQGWTRPVAWLGPTLAIFGSVLFSVVLLGAFGRGSVETREYYVALGERLAAAGHPLDASAGPVISDFPIWIAETPGVRALALPDEPPIDVLDLAATFPGTRLVVLTGGDDHLHWPEDLATEAPGSECFREIDLGVLPGASLEDDPLAETHVYELVCP